MQNRLKELYKKKLVSAEEAIQNTVRSGSCIALACGVAAPPALLEALAQNAEHYDNVRLLQAIGILPYRYFLEEIMEGHFVKESLYHAGPDRMAEQKKLSTIRVHSIHLSEAAKLMTNWRKINVFLGTASPMDKWGYFSLGTSTIYEKEALESADYVVLEVNQNIPRVHGDGLVHVSQVDYVVENDVPMFEIPTPPPDDTEKAIAQYISEMVPDGATLQLGIGSIPSAVAQNLMDRKDLGVHTELLVDVNVDLWEAGVITNKNTVVKGKMVGCLALGTNKLYKFLDDNPGVELRRGSFTNDVRVIAQNHALISINMTMQVDLCGQCASESLGTNQYSATGGQLDWVRGAQMSPEGKSIICLPSTAKNGTVSRIVPVINDGSYITTPRTDVEYIVTEYGVARLKGKPMDERARLMIQLAHPNFRDQLEEEAKRLRIIR